jgi:HPt (histidine-containing phosphotransfer) domain-containing protein
VRPVAPFDVADVRRRLGDDDPLITELFHLFLDTYRAHVTAIAAAVASRDLAATRDTAHLMKSDAGTLCAAALIAAAAALEDAAERGEIAALDRHFTRLAREVEALATQLRDLMA